MPEVTVRFAYSEQEFLAASRQRFIAGGKLGRLDFPVAAVFTIGAAAAFLLTEYTMASGIAFFTGCVFLIFRYWVSIELPKRHFRSVDKYREEYRLTFSDQGIRFSTPSIDSALEWSVYASWAESPDFFFLHQTAEMFTALPKRAFDSREDETNFRALLEAHIPAGPEKS